MPRHLMEHPEDVSIVRLPAGAEPGFDIAGGPFVSVAHTREETSVICLSARVPREATQEGPFRVVEVAGPLGFGSVGVMAEILGPLVRAGVSVLAFSTFDTDWVLVPAEQRSRAAEAWRRAGLIITTTSLTPGGRG